MKKNQILIAGGYVVALLAMFGWHLALGKPYDRATLPLLAVFALTTALIGLASLWAAVGMVHWANRAAGFVIVATIMVGAWLPLMEWSSFLIWQMVVMLSVQIGILVGVIALIWLVERTRLAGVESVVHRQFSVKNLLVLTFAMAIFFAVLRTVRPVKLDLTMYLLLIAGGATASLTTLVSLLVSRRQGPFIARALLFLLIAPIGGGVHYVGSQYQSLLFNSYWYAGVTTLQMVLMIVPLSLRGEGEAREGEAREGEAPAEPK